VTTITEDVSANGNIIVKKGSKLIGHVNFAVPLTRGGNSKLQIVFDKITFKDGETPFHGFIRKVIPPNGPAFGPSYPDPSITTDNPVLEPSRKYRRLLLPESEPPAPAEAPDILPGSVISSSKQNIQLESGTKIVLKTTL